MSSNKDNTTPFFCFKCICVFPLYQAMYRGGCVETLFVGMLNCGRQRMAHLGGMHNPSSRFSLGSSILEFWMQGGKERSWEGKRSSRVWEWTETRVENLVA